MWQVASTIIAEHVHHSRPVHHAVLELEKQPLRAPVLGVTDGHGELVRRGRWPLLHPSHIPDRILAREHRICAAVAMCEGCHGQHQTAAHIEQFRTMRTALQLALACLHNTVHLILPRARPPYKFVRTCAFACVCACGESVGGGGGSGPRLTLSRNLEASAPPWITT